MKGFDPKTGLPVFEYSSDESPFRFEKLSFEYEQEISDLRKELKRTNEIGADRDAKLSEMEKENEFLLSLPGLEDALCAEMRESGTRMMAAANMLERLKARNDTS